jgi:hypothetical protein
MKSLKSFLLSVLLISCEVLVFSQDCKIYFPDKPGAVREMSSYDNKDKFTGKTSQEILSVKNSESTMSLDVRTIITDSEGTEFSNSIVTLTCEDGVFKMDMSDYLSGLMESYQSMEIEMKGDNLTFPSSLSVGDVLKDASIDITISNNGMKFMSMQVIISNRKVVSKENVTTEAGSFDCFKITYDMETVTKIIKVKSSSVEWIADGVGVVKTESYNKKGKLTSYSLLSGLTK